MKTITLLSPPHDNETLIPDISLPSLSTYFLKNRKKNGCSIKIVDSSLWYNNLKKKDYFKNTRQKEIFIKKQILNLIEKTRPDILGISTDFFSLPFIIEFAKYFKKYHPDIPIMAGGIAPSVLDKNFFKLVPETNVVVSGEGEEKISEAVSAIENKQTGAVIAGSSSRPDISLDKPGPVDYSNVYPDHAPFTSLRLEGSRGCFFQCSFCTAKSVQKKYRQKKVSTLINEITSYISNYGVKDFYFTDNLFTLNNGWAEEFCKAVSRNNLKISWHCFSRIDTVSEKLLEKMAGAGCNSVFYGTESLSPKTLNFIQKTRNIKNYTNVCKKILKKTLELGMTPIAALMLGFPHETKNNMLQTLNFGKEIEAMGAKPHYSILTVLPGSKLWSMVEKRKLKLVKRQNQSKEDITELFADKYSGNPIITPNRWMLKNDHLSPQAMNEFISENLEKHTALEVYKNTVLRFHCGNDDFPVKIYLPQRSYLIKLSASLRGLIPHNLPYIETKLIIDYKEAAIINFKNSLNFNEYAVYPKFPIDKGEHTIVFAFKNSGLFSFNDNNLYFNFIDFLN